MFFFLGLAHLILVSLPMIRHRFCRQFTTSRPSADVAEGARNLYQKVMSWRKPKLTEKDLRDPSKDITSTEDIPEDSAPRDLRVLGRPPDVAEGFEEIKDKVAFSPWPTRHHRYDLTASDISRAVNDAFRNADDVHNLQTRFAAVKSVSKALNVGIPDHVLTSMRSVDDLKSYLKSIACPYDERQPDAIYLRKEDFVGTNITLVDVVADRRSRKARYEEMLKKARELQQENTEKLLA